MSHSTIRLDDLLARDMGVQWFEAVAIVQSACRQVLQTGGGFPDSAGISLAADGSVAVTVGAHGSQGASAAAHLLAGMMSHDAPVRLRLVVSQATAGDDGYGSLGEFVDAVAYFERPTPAAILAELYDRAAKAPGRAEPPARLTQSPETGAWPRAKEQVASEPKPRQTDTSARVRRLAIAISVLAAVVCVAAGGVRLMFGASPNLAGAEASTSDSKNGDGDEPLERETAHRRADNSKRSIKAPVDTKPGSTLADGSARSQLQDVPGATSQPSGAPSSLKRQLPPEASRTGRASSVPVGYAEVVVVASGGPYGREPGITYSAADRGVTLPRHIYPKLAEEPSRPLETGDPRTILDLVIARDGLVESVKLRTPPRDVHEFMLVSAAKAWRFEPARFEGQPVRFLHSLAITAAD